jgi:hypothetical protein
VDDRLPKLDLPKLILEMHARTGFAAHFTHASESASRAEDISTTVCAVLLAEATNTGFEPLVRGDVPALRRSRLSWVKQNFIRNETLRWPMPPSSPPKMSYCPHAVGEAEKSLLPTGFASSCRYARPTRGQIHATSVVNRALPGTTWLRISSPARTQSSCPVLCETAFICLPSSLSKRQNSSPPRSCLILRGIPTPCIEVQ